ncbi:SAM-dependent methyltransferase TehB [Streptococcus dentasini]
MIDIDTEKLIPYKRMPNWTATTIPNTFIKKHNTKAGTWGKLTILSGQLIYYVLDNEGQVLGQTSFDKDSRPPLVPPQVWHRIEAASSDLEFYLEFYCLPADYFAKKYQIEPHSEVREAIERESIPANKTLDLGCGKGRNSLYLSILGHQVTSLDINQLSLNRLSQIAEHENLPIQCKVYDINAANLANTYDLILSTVVFMFLDPKRVPAIIRDMQESTRPGGYNLIVCAMDTIDAPCPMPFPFTFKKGELADYYKEWQLIKYNENFGHLHRCDENGNPIRIRFATMLARKI